MVREDGKRNFAMRENGSETSVFSGNTPRQAALKAARRITDVGTSEESAPRKELRLREKGTDKVHIYDAWAWEETAPEDAPEWLQDRDAITEANVSKQGIEHLEE
ncbi:MAG: non-histone chromosomal MC1 family protein [Halobacteriaceae archaeon]